MKHQYNFRLYLITDRALSHPRTIEEVVGSAVRGGVTAVQLREKECSTREYIELAFRIQKILKPQNIPLIINDRIDVALAVNADGVHIGQSDMPYIDARRIMGCDAVIGFSVETMQQALDAENFDVNYLGVSPIFATPTKTDTTTEWGLEGLRNLRTNSHHTLVAIGGIHPSNAESVIKAGADGLAVVSAICSSSNPEKASRQLRAIIDQNQQRE